MERTSAEIAEIERHKYFLSEKSGHDVGWEFAEQDWENRFGEQFRSSVAVAERPAAEPLVSERPVAESPGAAADSASTEPSGVSTDTAASPKPAVAKVTVTTQDAAVSKLVDGTNAARTRGDAPATRVDSEAARSSDSPSVIPAPRWRRFLQKLWSK